MASGKSEVVPDPNKTTTDQINVESSAVKQGNKMAASGIAAAGVFCLGMGASLFFSFVLLFKMDMKTVHSPFGDSPIVKDPRVVFKTHIFLFIGGLVLLGLGAGLTTLAVAGEPTILGALPNRFAYLAVGGGLCVGILVALVHHDRNALVGDRIPNVARVGAVVAGVALLVLTALFAFVFPHIASKSNGLDMFDV
jgi:hypothetical protein